MVSAGTWESPRQRRRWGGEVWKVGPTSQNFALACGHRMKWAGMTTQRQPCLQGWWPRTFVAASLLVLVFRSTEECIIASGTLVPNMSIPTPRAQTCRTPDKKKEVGSRPWLVIGVHQKQFSTITARLRPSTNSLRYCSPSGRCARRQIVKACHHRQPTCKSPRVHCRKNVRDLSVGDVLFVPSGAAVAWRAKGMEDEAMVARFCYVDASNFDSVKTQLPIYAAVEVGRPHWCAAAFPVSSGPGYLVWPMLRPVLSRMTTLNSTVRDLSDSRQSVSYIPAARSPCN